jgi:putative ABC transport system permease protein
MELALQNLRSALRSAGRNPGVTTVLLLTLSLGIGANVALFSVVNAVLLRPLPYKDSGRLVQIGGQMLSQNIPYHLVPYPDFAEWKAQNRSFEYLSAARQSSLNMTNHGEARRLSCLQVNADFLPMTGVPMLHGRGFYKEEDQPGARRVAVMNHPLWRQTFGSDPNVIGQTLTLDGNDYMVVGVLPEGFQFGGTDLDLYLPMAASNVRSTQTLSISVAAYARLKPGITMQTAQQDIDLTTTRLNQQYPARIPRSARVWGMREFMVRNVKLSLLILSGAVGLVLLIACVNVANILLARADVRQREMALRVALGAGRKRIVLQILNESMILSLAGGLLGVLLAVWGIHALVTTASISYPLLKTASLDLPVLGFALLLSIVTGVTFGFAPALKMAREGSSGVLWGSLKEGSHGASSGHASRCIHSLLVIFEVALSLMLLLAAGLLLRSFMHLQQVNPGFDPHGVLTATITLPQGKYSTGPKRMALVQEFLQNLEHAPGVESAGVVDLLPLAGTNSGTQFFPEGRPMPRPGESPIVWMRFMSEHYFRAMSIPLLSGRQFAESDSPPAPPVAIINQTMARRFWPGEDPVGKRFSMSPSGQGVPVFTVVGVAGDVHHTNLFQEPDAEMFLYYRQMPPARVTVAVRTRLDPSLLANPVRQALSAADKDLPVSRVTPMAQIFYSVAQRRHEIGIRMALGSPKERVFRMVTGEAMLLAVVGEALGLAAAFALRRLIDSQLYGSKAMDPLVFTCVPLALAAVAYIAALIPAVRATKVDPLIALRSE